MTPAALKTDLRIQAVDIFYEDMVALGKRRSPEQARRAVAALALLLANHIGDAKVLNEALDLVNRAVPEDRPDQVDESRSQAFEAAPDRSHFRQDVEITS